MQIIAVSPHLDDAALSVGASLAALARGGHDVTVLTCFTRSVPDPTGFALACQTDKGLGRDVDYLALRRAEDSAALAVLGVGQRHLDLPEAPHRGYTSAPDLFAGVHDGDDAWRDVLTGLAGSRADLWLAPQALGSHADHLQVLRAVVAHGHPTAFWRDRPYALRQPDAVAGVDLPASLVEVALDLDDTHRARRAEACACYTTQLGLQFGGEQAMRDALAGLAEPLAADEAALVALVELGAR